MKLTEKEPTFKPLSLEIETQEELNNLTYLVRNARVIYPYLLNFRSNLIGLLEEYEK